MAATALCFVVFFLFDVRYVGPPGQWKVAEHFCTNKKNKGGNKKTEGSDRLEVKVH